MTAKLPEAGTSDNCPDCNAGFLLPKSAAEQAMAEYEFMKKDDMHNAAIKASRNAVAEQAVVDARRNREASKPQQQKAEL